MRLHFAGITSFSKEVKVEENKDIYILESYYTFKKSNNRRILDWLAQFNNKIFLDSGAFSAMNSNATVKVDEYADWALKNTDVWENLANLDINFEEGWKNQQYLESRGLRPLPVIHLEDYGNKERRIFWQKVMQDYPYVCVGGMVVKNASYDFNTFLDWVFAHTMKYKTKVHGFGLTSLGMCSRYPFYSVDGTSWLKLAIFGASVDWDPIKMTTMGAPSKKGGFEYMKGVRMSHLKAHLGTMKQKQLNNFEVYKYLQTYYTDLWTKRGITWS